MPSTNVAPCLLLSFFFPSPIPVLSANGPPTDGGSKHACTWHQPAAGGYLISNHLVIVSNALPCPDHIDNLTSSPC